MQESMQLLGTLCCAIFAGAAIYINAVEHPARNLCGISAAVAEWTYSYKRATLMQAPLAILGLIFSVAAWILGASSLILVAGILLGIVVPFTFFAMMPTNKRLKALREEVNVEETKFLLKRWNRLHMVRSTLSLVALIAFLSEAAG